MTQLNSVPPLVSVIMPNFNGKFFVETSVGAVLKSNYPSIEVIFVDDCSTDGSLGLVHDRFGLDPRLIILRNERTLGAAAARNHAVSQSRGDILVFLDNDTEIEPSCIGELVKTLQRTSAAAAEAKVMDFDRRSIIQHAGVVLIPHTGRALARGGGESDYGQWDREDEVLALTTCLAVHRYAFEKARGFDEMLKVHSEDIDFSWRMWLAGCRTVFASSAKTFHKNKTLDARKRMSADEYTITFYLEKNALRTMLKNFELVGVLTSLPTALIITFGLASLAALRGGSNARLRASVAALIWNSKSLKDTLLQRQIVQRWIRKLSDQYVFEKIMDRKSVALYAVEYLRNREGKMKSSS